MIALTPDLSHFRFCVITRMESPCGCPMRLNQVKVTSHLVQPVDLKGCLNFRYSTCTQICFIVINLGVLQDDLKLIVRNVLITVKMHSGN